MSLLTIIQAAALDLGIPKPSVVFASGDLNVQKLLTVAQRIGGELYRMHAWPQLRTLSSISLLNGVESYTVATDFGRMVDETQWESDQRWPAFGPLTSQEWAWLKYGTIAIGPTRRYTVYGFPLSVKVSPTPGAGDVGTLIYYSYISNNWCESSLGVGQSAWASDTDNPRLPEELFILGIRARYLRTQGYAFQEADLEYRQAADTYFAQSIGGRTLDVGGGNNWDTPLVTAWNVPDGNYGN